MSRAEVHNNLWLTSITPEQHEKTCGYWYLVTTDHRSFTAFTSRACLYRWLEERGLDIDESKLAPHGEFSSQPIKGTYSQRWYFSDEEQAQFNNLQGVILETRQCDNAQYTLAKITRDSAGMRTVHLLNCNVKSRVVFPYFESDAMTCGHVTPEQAPALDANLRQYARN
jgi:hypothetical protein